MRLARSHMRRVLVPRLDRQAVHRNMPDVIRRVVHAADGVVMRMLRVKLLDCVAEVRFARTCRLGFAAAFLGTPDVRALLVPYPRRRARPR